MRYACLLLIFTVPTSVVGQRGLPDVKKEIDAYKKELKRLKKSYREAVVKSRTELDLKLSTLAKKFADSGNVDKAKRVEAEKNNLQLENSLEKRLDLENDITGRKYKFDARQWVMEFDSDGYIYVPLRGHENKRFPWVTLSETEVLYMNELGKLAVVNFSRDRKKFSMKIFEPQKGSGNLDASRIK